MEMNQNGYHICSEIPQLSLILNSWQYRINSTHFRYCTPRPPALWRKHTGQDPSAKRNVSTHIAISISILIISQTSWYCECGNESEEILQYYIRVASFQTPRLPRALIYATRGVNIRARTSPPTHQRWITQPAAMTIAISLLIISPTSWPHKYANKSSKIRDSLGLVPGAKTFESRVTSRCIPIFLSTNSSTSPVT